MAFCIYTCIWIFQCINIIWIVLVNQRKRTNETVFKAQRHWVASRRNSPPYLYQGLQPERVLIHTRGESDSFHSQHKSLTHACRLKIFNIQMQINARVAAVWTPRGPRGHITNRAGFRLTAVCGGWELLDGTTTAAAFVLGVFGGTFCWTSRPHRAPLMHDGDGQTGGRLRPGPKTDLPAVYLFLWFLDDVTPPPRPTFQAIMPVLSLYVLELRFSIKITIMPIIF